MRKKIAYLSTFYPYRGGIAQFNASLLKAFESIADAKPFTFKRQYPKLLFPGKTQYAEKDDKAVKIDAPRVLDSINPLTYGKTARQILKFSPDLLLTKYWMPFFAPALGSVAKKLRKKGVKSVAILDNAVPHEKRIGDSFLTDYFLKAYSGFIVMSEAVEKDLLSLKPDARYALLPHPIYDHFGEKIDKKQAREKLGIPLDKKVALFFGFIRKYKGLDLALKALALLPDDYLLVVAGEIYGDFKEYDKLIDELGVRNKVRLFVRYVPDWETPYFFSAADACILPYKSATQSGVSSIALSFDLPMIATNQGGLKEIVWEKGTGVLAARAEPRALADACLKYFEKEDRARFLENIAKLKKERSWKNFALGILELSEIL